MAIRWRTDDGRILNTGLVAISGGPDQYIFVIFSVFFFFWGGGSIPPVPPLDPRIEHQAYFNHMI